jgi:hypothetical protein
LIKTGPGWGGQCGTILLKILEISQDNLVSIAQTMEEEGGDRSEDELIDMMDDMQYNKGCLRKMAQTLMDS